LQKVKRSNIFCELIADFFFQDFHVGLFGLFGVSELIIDPVLNLLLTEARKFIITINDVAAIKDYFVGLQEFGGMLLFHKLDDSGLFELIDLNLFYWAFVFEEGHEFVLVQVRFGDVFDVNSAFLLSIVVFLVRLILVAIVIVLAVLRTWVGLLVVVALRVGVLLLIVGFLHDWSWGYPRSARLGGRARWRRWEEHGGGFKSDRLSFRFGLVLYLIIWGDTLVKFGFFGRLTGWHIIFGIGVIV
jgi:hypothetical protein